MSLLGLPTELLDDIILQVYNNGDLKSIAQSCKRIYQLSKPHLEQDHIFRRQWRHVAVSEKQSIFSVLAAIAREPVIARFVRDLDLRSADESADERTRRVRFEPQNGGYVKYGEDAEFVRTLVRSLPQLTLAKHDASDWIVMIMPLRVAVRRARDQDFPTSRDMVMHRIVLLLTLLPNLERLRLPKFWARTEAGEPETWKEVLSVMVNVANDRRDILGPEGHSEAPLARLGQLLPSQETDEDGRCRAGLKEVAPLFLLPGLEQVHIMKYMAHSNDNMYSGISFDWSGSPRVSLGDAMSNVRSLHFEACCIDAANIGRILERMSALTSLRYSHHATWNGAGHNWNAGAFAAAVSAHCGSQLTQLSLTVRHRMGAIEGGIVSLHELTALKEVQLDLQMFAAPPSASDFRSRFGGLSLAADAESNINGILPLSQILPIGMERVSLVMHAGHGIEHGQSELDIVRKQLRTLKALFAADLTISHRCLQQLILRHDGQAIDLGMHTIVGQSGKRSDVSLESQVARLLRGTGVVGVLIDDSHDAFESMPWENGDEY
ncbi:unnamed protein product [Cercospora beticola]|nr:unnamed protein product [Cercospora beticola]